MPLIDLARRDNSEWRCALDATAIADAHIEADKFHRSSAWTLILHPPRTTLRSPNDQTENKARAKLVAGFRLFPVVVWLMLTLREQLIEAKFWDAEEARDPATGGSASVVLLNAMKKRLVNGAYVSYCVSLDGKQDCDVYINQDDERRKLATDSDLYIAICNAALALPAFLLTYPECAK